ncbi:hypothetical protein MMC30_008016 [Trapelia coarctata]|nr:hypothetical protein [Trapelia coarctata]
MQASSHIPDRRGSSTSQYSKSPETTIAFPPSPISSEDKPSSHILEAIQLLRNRRACILEDNWNTIKLQPGEYEELWQRLGKEDEKLLGYIQDKISVDYDPGTWDFVVRMPTNVHERLGCLIRSDIIEQLAEFRKGNNLAATLAQNIRPSGSASIFLEDGARRDPDMQFKYNGAHYPSLIVEIANTQSKKDGGKDLPKLADQYITESGGSIRTVIGISLDYQCTKKATLSIWHPKYGSDVQGEYFAADETVMSQEFRTANGTRVTQRTLRLPLKHFPLPELLPPGDCEQEILIPYEKLADYLEEAEVEDQFVRMKAGALGVVPMGMRKRKRDLTPPETLNMADERRFEREELAAERLAEKEDEEWKESLVFGVICTDEKHLVAVS